MRKIVVHFPIVVYPSEGEGMRQFSAHCLNLDLLADDDSVQGAIGQLLELIEQQLDAAEEFGADPFQARAPDRYWKMLGNAKRVPEELLERIIKEANARHANTPPGSTIDSSQIDARELQTA